LLFCAYNPWSARVRGPFLITLMAEFLNPVSQLVRYRFCLPRRWYRFSTPGQSDACLTPRFDWHPSQAPRIDSDLAPDIRHAIMVMPQDIRFQRALSRVRCLPLAELRTHVLLWYSRITKEDHNLCHHQVLFFPALRAEAISAVVPPSDPQAARFCGRRLGVQPVLMVLLRLRARTGFRLHSCGLTAALFP